MDTIGQIDIKSLSEKYGTPVYIYDKQKIVQNYTKIKDAFAKNYQKTKIHFSVKANSNLHILKIFNEIGCGADCSSPIELELSRRAGLQDDKILYTGNYESLSDFESIKNLNIRINLDDISSFQRLIKIHKPEQISFRINPGIGRGGFEGITTAGSDAKFGVPYEMAYEAYAMAKEAGVKRFGIHMMTGSNNLEPYYFAESLDKLMTIAGRIFQKLDIKPEYFDIGGGFGMPYEDGEDELNIDLTAKLIAEVFLEKNEKYGFGEPELILEPGRYLIANAGYLLASITGIKKSYKNFVGIDAGMNTLIRPALYGAKHRVNVYGKDKNESLVNLCGQICENSDIFSKNLPFPTVEEGDLVIIHDVGAYGFVMSSNYNGRLRPAEVLIDEDKTILIRRKETIEDVISLF
jgi:diaminopimelate decarboxylase